MPSHPCRKLTAILGTGQRLASPEVLLRGTVWFNGRRCGGGGLFDSRGNLVGITTLVKVDRRRLNQSLNFAIAAEDFWQK